MKPTKYAFILIAALSFCTSHSVWAGNGIVCFADPAIPLAIRAENSELSSRYISKIQSIELLDIYEAKQKWKLTETLPNETASQYLERILARTDLAVPDLAKHIREERGQLPEWNILHQPSGLLKVDDATVRDRFDATYCVLVTLAANGVNGSQYALHLDTRLFRHKSHSIQSQAALLLHEYLYLGAHRADITNSDKIREVVGLLLSDDPRVTVGLLEAATHDPAITAGKAVWFRAYPLLLLDKLFDALKDAAKNAHEKGEPIGPAVTKAYFSDFRAAHSLRSVPGAPKSMLIAIDRIIATQAPNEAERCFASGDGDPFDLLDETEDAAEAAIDLNYPLPSVQKNR